jgi:hypothetical protein
MGSYDQYQYQQIFAITGCWCLSEVVTFNITWSFMRAKKWTSIVLQFHHVAYLVWHPAGALRYCIGWKEVLATIMRAKVSVAITLKTWPYICVFSFEAMIYVKFVRINLVISSVLSVVGSFH